MGIFNRKRPVIAIDAGTENLRVSHNGQVIFDEATAIAIHLEKQKIDQIGNPAASSKGLQIIWPYDYVIKDFQAFEMLLKGVTHKVNQKALLPSPSKMFFSVPPGASEVDLRAFRDAGEHNNAIEIYMCRSSLLAALGLDILSSQQSFLLVDFSASKFEVTAFINGKPDVNQTLQLGSQKLEKLISNHLKRNNNLEAYIDEVRQILNSYGSREETLTIQY